MWKILGYVGAGLAGVGTAVACALTARVSYLQRACMIDSLDAIREHTTGEPRVRRAKRERQPAHAES